MSWSLKLRNGDLVLDGARLGQVVGVNKLVQDLSCALIEPRGNDNMHTSYGSIIDGGRDDNGIQQPSLIGQGSWEVVAAKVKAEISRISKVHQEAQLARAKADRYTYGQSTLDPGELLLRVADINIFQIQDSMLVRVVLSTANNQQVTVDVPVDGSTINYVS